MKRTNVTYGQLDKALRLLGFTCRPLDGKPPARLYNTPPPGQCHGPSVSAFTFTRPM